MGLVGEGALVTGVLPDVFPTIDVEDLQTDGWAIEGWLPAEGFESQVAAAAMRSQVHLNNLPTSGKMCVVEEIWVSTNVASVMSTGFSAITAIIGTTTNLRAFRDRRIQALRPTLVVSENLAAGFVGSTIFRVLPNTVMVITPPKGVAVLPPGFAMTVSNGTVNVALDCTYFWRERPVETSELTL